MGRAKDFEEPEWSRLVELLDDLKQESDDQSCNFVFEATIEIWPQSPQLNISNYLSLAREVFPDEVAKERQSI